MNHRLRSLFSALAVAVLVAVLAPAFAAAQGSTPAKAWTARTPDGQPDLQGYWSNATYTPLVRPNNVTKEFYTKEEAEEAARRAAAREAEQTVPGTTQDVHYDFTQFALDRSQTTLAQNLRTSLIVDPPDGRIPPMTPEGQKRAADRQAAARVPGGQYDSVQNMNIGTRCIIMGAGPPMLPQGYNSNYQIVQAPGYVMILIEMIGDVRIIPLDGRPALNPAIRQWMGDSRGRWEGDTLIVETTNFNNRAGNQNLRGVSDNFKLIERFRRVDENTLMYEFTVNDPTTFTKPWTAQVPFAKTEGPIFEMACHEGNYGVANTLAGARAEERRAAEAAAKQGGSQQD